MVHLAKRDKGLSRIFKLIALVCTFMGNSLGYFVWKRLTVYGIYLYSYYSSNSQCTQVRYLFLDIWPPFLNEFLTKSKPRLLHFYTVPYKVVGACFLHTRYAQEFMRHDNYGGHQKQYITSFCHLTTLQPPTTNIQRCILICTKCDPNISCVPC